MTPQRYLPASTFKGREPGADESYTIPDEWRGFPDEGLNKTDPALREAFRDAAAARARDLIEQVAPRTRGFKGFLFNRLTGGVGALAEGFVRHKLNEALELPG